LLLSRAASDSANPPTTFSVQPTCIHRIICGKPLCGSAGIRVLFERGSFRCVVIVYALKVKFFVIL
jgi:hypothetical protein